MSATNGRSSPVDPSAPDYDPYSDAGIPEYQADYGRGIRGRAAADRLQALLERARGWPIWSVDGVGGVQTGTYPQVGKYGKSMRDIALWQAFRESDRERIISITNWDQDRPIHIDPLPERIPTAYSDLLYGDDPDFFAASRTDQDLMDDLVRETQLTEELRRWVEIFVSEGECWWRAWTDLDISDWPLLEGHSRINVVPLFAGRKIIAAGFVDDVLTQEIRVENQIVVIFWRHIEIHTVGYVRNLLYRGTIGQLGEPMALTSLAETADLDDDWDHGLPIMLAGRYENNISKDFRLGRSEFQGVRDLILDLYEARTIMAENARLVLKARMVLPASALDPEGNFDASKDVITAESVDEELGNSGKGPYTVLEYNFKSRELIEHKTELALDILSRCGLTEQFTQESRGGGGQAFTGTALRTKLIPTTLAAAGKSKVVDRETPKVLQALAMLSGMPMEKGGCGKSWSNVSGPHVQQRATVLPDDPNEEVQRHVMAVQGEVESIQTAVEALHSNWDEDRIAVEVARIRADREIGPTYSGPDEDMEDIVDKIEEAGTADITPDPNSPDIPPVPPGGPGSAVPTSSSVLGSQQPGVSGTASPVKGQSPGTRKPPTVPGGGPR